MFVKNFKEKAIAILKLVNTKHFYEKKIKLCGSQCFFKKVCKTSKGNIPSFNLNENLFLDSSFMAHKSIVIQKALIKYVKKALGLGHSLRLYNGYISGADSTPVYTTKGVFWVDKRNCKPIYRELAQVRRIINNKLRHKKGIDLILGRIENPHHLSPYNHIYSHAHYHYLVSITDQTDAQSGLNYIKSTFEKAFIKVFGYKPSHCENALHPLYYTVDDKKNYEARDKFSPTIKGKGDPHYVKKYPVIFTPNPCLRTILHPYTYTSNNVAYNRHRIFFNKHDKGKIQIDSNLMGYLAMCFYVIYLCQDYRIQVKDSDNLIGNKKSPLNKSQQRLIILADIDSGKNLAVVNSIATKKNMHHHKAKSSKRSTDINIKPVVDMATIKPNYIKKPNVELALSSFHYFGLCNLIKCGIYDEKRLMQYNNKKQRMNDLRMINSTKYALILCTQNSNVYSATQSVKHRQHLDNQTMPDSNLGKLDSQTMNINLEADDLDNQTMNNNLVADDLDNQTHQMIWEADKVVLRSYQLISKNSPILLLQLWRFKPNRQNKK